MPGMRKRTALVQLSAQAPREAAQVGPRARFAVQPVLRTARLPQTQDTAVAALSRTQGVSGGGNRPGLNPARERHGITHAAADCTHPRRSQNGRAMANVVARCLYGNALLANRTRQLHAARR